MKKTTLGVTLLAALLLSILVRTPFPNLATAQTSGTMTIKADGSVEGTDRIQHDGNLYKFLGNINGSLFIEKDSVVVDGGGYTLQDQSRGIVLSERNNVTIRNVKIEMEGGYGIYLVDSSNCTVSGNEITGSNLPYCIYLWGSFNNTVEDNRVTNSFRGIRIYRSYGNVVKRNNVTDNRVGIDLHDCSGNVLRKNQLTNSSFVVPQYPSYEYDNDVDASNTIDGAPIIYWVNEHDKNVPSDAACVILVNCTRISIQNFSRSIEILLVFITNSTIADNKNNIGVTLIHSSNNRILANNVHSQSTGIQLEESSNNDIVGNHISQNDRGIRLLYSSNNNTISGNHIEANDYGIDDIQTTSSTGNTISGNNITANNIGVCLYGSNTFSENNIVRNSLGIILHSSSNVLTGNDISGNGDGVVIAGSDNKLRNNSMYNNTFNFRVQSGFVNDVDASNTVDGKPVYYWVNQQDKTVPPDAGYVVLVSCTRISVQNLTLENNGQGIFLIFTTHSVIAKNSITVREEAIRFFGSSNNFIVGNNIKGNGYGLYFSGALFLDSVFYPSVSNVIHHNNFISNSRSVYDIADDPNPYFPTGTHAISIWDDGKQGNYWSEYRGSDANLDGIGDTPQIINAKNKDNYPILAPVYVSSVALPSPSTSSTSAPSLSPSPSPSPPVSEMAISILSPQNITYAATDVPLNLNLPESVEWVGYSLDGQANVTLAGNTTLSGLADGSHYLTVYANNTAGNSGISQTVFFTMSLEPEPSLESEPYPTTLVIAASTSVAFATGAGLLVYFKKRKRISPS